MKISGKKLAFASNRRGANDMRDGNDIKGFQKVLSKLSTVLTLAIQGAPLEENPWGNPPEPTGEASTEEETPAETNAKQRSFTVADLVGGDIPTVPDGHSVVHPASDPPLPEPVRYPPGARGSRDRATCSSSGATTCRSA
jgi:hypothetical protein